MRATPPRQVLDAFGASLGVASAGVCGMNPQCTKLRAVAQICRCNKDPKGSFQQEMGGTCFNHQVSLCLCAKRPVLVDRGGDQLFYLCSELEQWPRLAVTPVLYPMGGSMSRIRTSVLMILPGSLPVLLKVCVFLAVPSLKPAELSICVPDMCQRTSCWRPILFCV